MSWALMRCPVGSDWMGLGHRSKAGAEDRSGRQQRVTQWLMSRSQMPPPRRETKEAKD